MEPFYPLHAASASECFLVQLEEYVRPARSSATTPTSRRTRTAGSSTRGATSRMIERFGSTRDSQVVEVASNDGYLLQYFVERGIPVLGSSRPRTSPRWREQKGIPTLVEFFGVETARELAGRGRQADLCRQQRARPRSRPQRLRRRAEDPARSRRRAHDGVPAPVRLIEENQFDTIYHEHFSYFSFPTVERSSRRTASRCSTSRNCRRTAVRCGSSAPRRGRRASRSPSVRRELLEREEARVSTRSRHYAASPTGRRGQAARSSSS